jgi:hypothetical protein
MSLNYEHTPAKAGGEQKIFGLKLAPIGWMPAYNPIRFKNTNNAVERECT